MYTDIHNHILWETDDGSESLDMSLEMADQAMEQGISTLVTTPHFFEETQMEKAVPYFRQRYELACEEFEKRSLPLKLVLGSEVYFQMGLTEIAKEPTLTYGGQRKYLLVEFPQVDLPRAFRDVLFQVYLSGVTPIVAHPERNARLCEDINRVRKMVRVGALLQCNAGSLIGVHGRQAQRTIHKLLDENIVTFLASDAHNTTGRRFRIGDACKILTEKWGEQRCQALAVDNPSRMLAGEKIEAPEVILTEEREPDSFFTKLKKVIVGS